MTKSQIKANACLQASNHCPSQFFIFICILYLNFQSFQAEGIAKNFSAAGMDWRRELKSRCSGLIADNAMSAVGHQFHNPNF